MSLRPVRFFLDGWRVALAGDAGRKYLPLIPLDAGGLSVVRIDKNEQRTRIDPLDYDLAKALRKFRAAATKSFGATEEVKDLLSRAQADVSRETKRRAA